jgi:hypothetical protein
VHHEGGAGQAAMPIPRLSTGSKTEAGRARIAEHNDGVGDNFDHAMLDFQGPSNTPMTRTRAPWFFPGFAQRKTRAAASRTPKPRGLTGSEVRGILGHVSIAGSIRELRIGFPGS